MDRLQAMTVFCRVVDCQGFAAAARELDMSPSVVTRLVNELEAHLGVRLLNRTTRTLALTAAGDRYLEQSRKLLLELEDIEREATSATTELAGHLRVLVPPAFAVHQLARALPAFHARYPGIVIELVSPGMVETVDEGFDVSIVITASGQLDGRFVARRLMCTHVIACASPAFLDRQGRAGHPGDEVELNLMHSSYVKDMRFKPEQEVFKPSPSRTVAIRARRPAMISPHTDTLFAAAMAGLGASCFPSYVVDEALKQGRLERVLPGWSLSVLHGYATYPSRQFMPMKTRVFLDFLVETYGGQERDPWLGL